MNILEKLSEIQHELKAPKGQFNSFGNYKYRSCEDILEAVKPICYKHKATLVIGDEILASGDRAYVKATATLYDQESNEKIENTAYAREAEEKKGLDVSQITGTASSYARKYCLSGLLAIDDTKDADTDEYTGKQAIDKTKIEALQKSIANNNIPAETVSEVLSKFGYSELEDITVANYMKVVAAFKENK